MRRLHGTVGTLPLRVRVCVLSKCQHTDKLPLWCLPTSRALEPVEMSDFSTGGPTAAVTRHKGEILLNIKRPRTIKVSFRSRGKKKSRWVILANRSAVARSCNVGRHQLVLVSFGRLAVCAVGVERRTRSKPQN